MSKYNTVYMIEWIDAASLGVWLEQSAVITFGREENLVQSVGHLVYKTTDYIVLAGSMCTEGFSNNVVKIPRALIRSIKRVRSGGEVDLQ